MGLGGLSQVSAHFATHLSSLPGSPGSSWSYPQEEVRATGKTGYLNAIEKCLLSHNIVLRESPTKGWFRLVLNSWSYLTWLTFFLWSMCDTEDVRISSYPNSMVCVEADNFVPFLSFLSTGFFQGFTSDQDPTQKCCLQILLRSGRTVLISSPPAGCIILLMCLCSHSTPVEPGDVYHGQR